MPARDDVVVSEPDDEGKEHNVVVEQRHVEENSEMQGNEPAAAEPVTADNAAPVIEEPVDGSKAMASPASEALKL